MIRAGTLRHQIIIKKKQESLNEYNEPIKTRVPYLTTRAKVKPIKGTETYINHEIHSDLTHLITLRYHEGITPLQRVIYGDRVLEILSVIDVDERHRAIQILAKEDADDG